jgi:hypothetical protein
MKTKQCSHCRALIHDELVYCPYCLTRQTATFKPKTEVRDPYQILQVSPHARVDVIEAAYRRLARMYHPDLNPDVEAQNKMKDINWARDLLRDPIERVEWDHRHDAARREAAPSSPAPAPPPAPTPHPSARVPQPAPVKLPALAWIALAAIGLALSVALLPRVNPADTAAAATGAPSTATAAAAIATAQAVASAPALPTLVINPLRAGGCLLWTEIGPAHIGQDLCIFGIIIQNEPRSGSVPTVIQFSDTWTDFKVHDFNRSYADLLPGMCVLVRGRVVDDVSFLMITPSNTPNSVALYPNPADCR